MALAVPQFTAEDGENYSMLDHILTYLEFVKGTVMVVHSRPNVLENDPWLSKYRRWEELGVRPLAPDVHSAIEGLGELNEATYGTGRTESQVSELQAMTYHAACRRAIFYLKECFEKCAEPDTRGYCLAWPLQAGPDYITAIKDRQSLALLIMMYWGVLLEQISYDIWWAQRIGKCLIDDLANEMSNSNTETFDEGIKWAREQVGLEA